MSKERQRWIMEWAERNFGSVALSRQERAARCVEEAIEIAQAERLPFEVLMKIASRVYERPPGSLAQEIGGMFITLEAMAEVAGLDAEQCAQAEYGRIVSLPREHWERKHAEKVAAGTANVGASL
jgi:hypothetical protein